MLPLRICIYPKDVVAPLGRSCDAAMHLLRQARATAGKLTGALFTVADFCHYTGSDEHEVTTAINPPLRRTA